jgi:hypothetical protein
VVDEQAERRREYTRKLVRDLGKIINGPVHKRMSFLASAETRRRIEAIRANIAARQQGERNVNLSDVIRTGINTLYWDLIGEGARQEQKEAM